MAIHRLNHAVLYVRNVARSVAFYRDVLGFDVITAIAGKAAFLRAGAGVLVRLQTPVRQCAVVDL